MYSNSENYLMTPDAGEEKSLPLAAFRKAEKHPILKKPNPRNVHSDHEMESCVQNESCLAEKDRLKACAKKSVVNKLQAVNERKKRKRISFVLNDGAECRKVNFAIGDSLFGHTEKVLGSQVRVAKRSKRLKKCKLNIVEDK